LAIKNGGVSSAPVGGFPHPARGRGHVVLAGVARVHGQVRHPARGYRRANGAEPQPGKRTGLVRPVGRFGRGLGLGAHPREGEAGGEQKVEPFHAAMGMGSDKGSRKAGLAKWNLRGGAYI
jgi:hypothetical protein